MLLHTRRSSTRSDISHVSNEYKNSPDDGHTGARNMYRIERNKHTIIIVRQDGYLPGSYQDSRSTKHEISSSANSKKDFVIIINMDDSNTSELQVQVNLGGITSPKNATFFTIAPRTLRMPVTFFFN